MELYPANLPGLTFDSKKAPSYSTDISESKRGKQWRVKNLPNPIWQFHLEYEFLRDQGFPSEGPWDELNTLRGFFMARSGSGDDFLYYDPDDNTVTDGPLPMIQGQAGWMSPVQAIVGAGLSVPAFFDITDLVPTEAPDGSDVLIKDNGTAQVLDTDYTLDQSLLGVAVPVVNDAGNVISAASYDGLWINWLHPPTGPVTASFQYYFRVHFGNYQGTQRSQSGLLDSLELVKIFNRMWEAKTIEFESVIP